MLASMGNRNSRESSALILASMGTGMHAVYIIYTCWQNTYTSGKNKSFKSSSHMGEYLLSQQGCGVSTEIKRVDKRGWPDAAVGESACHQA